MTHREEGELQAYLDGELPEGRSRDIRRHLDGCAACRGVLDELRARGALLGSVLATDGPVPDLEAARWEVRRRWAARRARARRQWSLRAAAVIVLVSGVAAASMPGSPVRALMSEGWDRMVALVSAEEETEAPSGPEVTEAEVEDAEAVAGRVATAAGPDGLEVRLEGVRSGTEIRVTRVSGRSGALEVGGDPGGFHSAEGLLRAEVGHGPVRVELPEDAVEARVLVNGELLAVLRDGHLEAPGLQPEDTGDDEATFRY